MRVQIQLLQTISLLAIGVGVVNAQTGQPAYKGALLIEPGVNSGLCLTAKSDVDGAIVTTETCTGSPNQKWTFNSGSMKIFSNKCLDVTEGSDVNGNKLQIWTCFAGSVNQQFFYNYWNNQLSWKDKGKCVDLSGGRQTPGNQIQIWTCNGNANQVWNSGYMYNALPNTSEDGQFGTNNCGTTNSPTSKCQTVWMNSLNDFCLWAPATRGTIGDKEREVVAYCTNTARGTRSIPNGALKGVHFVKTMNYVQVTGVGDFTLMNVTPGDQGGELDPHGADANGNPIGGLVYGNTFGPNLQYHEWTSFMSASEFCFRACVGPDAARNCQHIYDVMGCYWNMPANYNAGTFEQCDADNDLPMGVYGTSTWHQGTSPTPPAHPAAKSSNCVTQPTVTAGVVPKPKGSKKREVTVPVIRQMRGLVADVARPTAPPS